MTRQGTIISTVLAGVLAMPAAAGAEPAAEAAVRIEVDVSALPKGDRATEDTQRWVLRNQTTVLEGAGFVVRDDASEVVRIQISRYGEYGVNTKAKLMVVGDDASVREFTCEACTDSQFVEKVDQETALLVEHMQSQAAAEPEPVAEPEPEAEPDPATEAAADDGSQQSGSDEPVDHEGKRIGPAGYAGIGALALGLGMTIGGVLVVTSEPTVRLLPDDMHVWERTSRKPLGVGLTVTGASLLVAGAVLVAVDQTVLRKRRDRRSNAALLPSLSPTGAGLALTGRF